MGWKSCVALAVINFFLFGLNLVVALLHDGSLTSFNFFISLINLAVAFFISGIAAISYLNASLVKKEAKARIHRYINDLEDLDKALKEANAE